MRKKVFLVSLLVLGVGCGWLRPPQLPAVELDLRQLLSRATLGPIVGPQGALGGFEAGPFLGMGWDVVGPAEFRRTLKTNPRGSHLRFYLDCALPLEISLEGRASSPGKAALLLNGTPWNDLAPGPDWKRFIFQAQPEQLREGANDIQLNFEPASEWKNFAIKAPEGGRGFSQTPLEPGLAGEDLQLPYGRSVAYPVNLDPHSVLVLDDLKPWKEAGAASAPEGSSELWVRIRSASLDKSWTITKAGPQRLSLPVPAPASAELFLMARTQVKPALGQAGLSLKHPRLVSDQVEAVHPNWAEPHGEGRPNVIIYLIDTLRADHLGCYGYAQPTSPCIDKFRGDSVLFAQCTAQSGWTKASTASILCSMLPRVHGGMDFGDKLHPTSTLISQVLRAAGYETRAVVTNPFVSAAFGFDRGFDHFQLLEEATSAQVNDSILPWLKQRRSEQPFFLYVHTLDPHMPYGRSFTDADLFKVEGLSAQLDYWGKARTGPDIQTPLTRAVKAYDGEIAANDAAFGALLTTLKERGLYDNTIIVLVSDHGEEFLEHGRMGHNNSLYQELLHVPLLIKFAQSRAAGTRVEPCWQHIDIAPTILGSLGVKPAPTMVGRAYTPGGATGDPERLAFISLKTGVDAPRWGQGKSAWLLDMDAVQWGSWMFTRTWACHDGRHQPQQLFDLSSDPKEGSDQTYRRPEIRVRLNALLQEELGKEGRDRSPSSQAPSEEVQRFMRSLQYMR